MFTKTIVALSTALILGSVSGAVAQGPHGPDEGWVSAFPRYERDAMQARAAVTVRRSRDATSAFARSRNTPARLSSDAVIVDGRVVGRDPDPNVRDMIRRDWRETPGGM